MPPTTAKYFDGVSSAPQQVLIEVNEETPEINIYISDFQSKKWILKEIVFEQNEQFLEIRQKSGSLASLKISDNDFINHFLKVADRNGHVGWYFKWIHLSIKVYIAIALTILGLGVLGYIFIIPLIAERAVLVIPEKYDDYLATKFLNDFFIDNKVDTSKTLILHQFASGLKLGNRKPLHFKVVKSGIVNAFALPDGTIIIYTGLLNRMDDYDELAGLIGHEVSHINDRHSMKMLCRNLSGRIFISLIFSDINGLMEVITDNARNLQSLSYSRQFEKQADEQGTDLMIINRINPNGMIKLFTRLKTEEKVTVPVFISTHPMTCNRIQEIQKIIKEKSFVSVNNSKLEKIFRELKKD
jgi:beta-barrel assembly-enhancing protease